MTKVQIDQRIIAQSVQLPKVEAPMQMSEAVARPDILHGRTYKLKPGDHAFYITINNIELQGVRKVYEIFINSKATEAYPWVIALSRMLSAVFRKGGDSAFLLEELKNTYDPAGGFWSGGEYVPSIVAGIGRIIEAHMKDIGMI